MTLQLCLTLTLILLGTIGLWVAFDALGLKPKHKRTHATP